MKDSILVVETQAAIFPPLLPLPVHCFSVSSCCTFNAKNPLLDILTAFKELFVCQEVLRTCSANIEQQAENELHSLETMCRSPQNLHEDEAILNIASQRRISNLINIKAKERQEIAYLDRHNRSQEKPLHKEKCRWRLCTRSLTGKFYEVFK